MADLMLSFPWEATVDDPPPSVARSVRPVRSARPAHLRRVVADSTDRVAWLRARSQGITATDVARLSTQASVESVALEKIYGSRFSGNAYTDHGVAREPVVAAWVLANYGISPSSALFHAESDRKHLATPDGVAVRRGGLLELAEIKTTNKGFRSVPRSYLRQIWWQQYVLGAERTLFVWEQHNNFVPIAREPECRWIERDENAIAILVGLANQLLEMVARHRR